MNSINRYELKLGVEYTILSSESYLIFSGNGYVSFGETKYNTLKIDEINEIILPYELNNIYYKLSRNWNILEVSSSTNIIEVYINDYDYKCNDLCPINAGDVVNIVNWNNAQKEKVKLYFIYREAKYTIDLEKGDTVKYIVDQSFTFEVANSLANKYLKLKEGILAVYGYPSLTINGAKYYVQNYLTYQLYYIMPYNNSIIINAQTNLLENEITIKGLNPTISINFPDTWNKQITTTKLGPQYLRININKIIDENFSFDFGVQ